MDDGTYPLLVKNPRVPAVARVLLYLHARKRPLGGNELPLGTIADEIGMSYTHLNNTLYRLRKLGIVAREDGVLVIK